MEWKLIRKKFNWIRLFKKPISYYKIYDAIGYGTLRFM
jgi:hypothetical protein